MGEFKRALLLIGFFSAFYLLFGFANFYSFGTVNNGQDFEFHWARVQGIEVERDYPVGYHLIFSIFGFHELGFYAANVFLIMAIIPLLLFKFCKKWWSVALYFGGIGFSHQMLYGATYPQALIMAFFLIYLNNRRKWPLLLLLTIASYFVHHYGVYLFLGIWVLELALPFIKRFKGFLAVGWLQASQLQGGRGVIELLLLQMPVPTLYFGLLEMKDGFFALLVAGSIIAAVQDFRAISIAQLVLVALAGGAISKRPKRIKIGFAIFLIFQTIFYMLDFGLGTISFITMK